MTRPASRNSHAIFVLTTIAPWIGPMIQQHMKSPGNDHDSGAEAGLLSGRCDPARAPIRSGHWLPKRRGRNNPAKYVCIPQLFHDDCAVAALRTWLAVYDLPCPASLSRLAEVRGGVTLEQVTEPVLEVGCRPLWVEYDNTAKLCGLPLPAIALLRSCNGQGHYVVLLETSKEQILFADPSSGDVKASSSEDFQAAWTGQVLLASPPIATTKRKPQHILDKPFWSDLLGWAVPMLWAGVLLSAFYPLLSITRLALFREVIFAVVHRQPSLLSGMLVLFCIVSVALCFLDHRTNAIAVTVRQVVEGVMREFQCRYMVSLAARHGPCHHNSIPPGQEMPVSISITKVADAAAAMITCMFEVFKVVPVLAFIFAIESRLGSLSMALLVSVFGVSLVVHRHCGVLAATHLRLRAATETSLKQIMLPSIGRCAGPLDPASKARKYLVWQLNSSSRLEAQKALAGTVAAATPLLFVAILVAPQVLPYTHKGSPGPLLLVAVLAGLVLQHMQRIMRASPSLFDLAPHVNRVRLLLELVR